MLKRSKISRGNLKQLSGGQSSMSSLFSNVRQPPANNRFNVNTPSYDQSFADDVDYFDQPAQSFGGHMQSSGAGPGSAGAGPGSAGVRRYFQPPALGRMEPAVAAILQRGIMNSKEVDTLRFALHNELKYNRNPMMLLEEFRNRLGMENLARIINETMKQRLLACPHNCFGLITELDSYSANLQNFGGPEPFQQGFSYGFEGPQPAPQRMSGEEQKAYGYQVAGFGSQNNGQPSTAPSQAAQSSVGLFSKRPLMQGPGSVMGPPLKRSRPLLPDEQSYGPGPGYGYGYDAPFGANGNYSNFRHSGPRPLMNPSFRGMPMRPQPPRMMYRPRMGSQPYGYGGEWSPRPGPTYGPMRMRGHAPMRPIAPRFEAPAPFMPPPPVRHPADSQEEYYDPMNFFDVEAVRMRIPVKIGDLLNRAENGSILPHDDISLLRTYLVDLLDNGNPLPAAAVYRSVLPKETFNRVFNEGVVARVVLYARWWRVPIDALIACVGPDRDIESYLTASMPHSASGMPPYISNPLVDEKTKAMKEGQLARVYSTEGVGNNVDRIENHFQKDDPCDYQPSEIPGVLMVDGKFMAPIRTRKWFNSVMYVLHRRGFDCRAFVAKMTEHFGQTAMDEALQYRKNRWFVGESAKRFGPNIVPIKQSLAKEVLDDLVKKVVELVEKTPKAEVQQEKTV